MRANIARPAPFPRTLLSQVRVYIFYFWVWIPVSSTEEVELTPQTLQDNQGPDLKFVATVTTGGRVKNFPAV